MTILYRVFSDVAHAKQFLAGQVRLGHLSYYRQQENGRGDRTEGEAHHFEYRADRAAVRIADGDAREVSSPGLVSMHTECGNEVFISCFTQPPNAEAWSRISQEFGSIVVQVNDADRLRVEIQNALDKRDPWQRRASVALWPVQYTKGKGVFVNSCG